MVRKIKERIENYLNTEAEKGDYTLNFHYCLKFTHLIGFTVIKIGDRYIVV